MCRSFRPLTRVRIIHVFLGKQQGNDLDMLLDNHRSVLFFMLLAAIFVSVIEISECTANKRNLINVTEPEESDIWITGQTSYSIAWTQSKFSFKWDIALLDRQRNKVSDISKGLSEFDDFKMTHNWLIPQSIQSGNYRIEICASGSPDDCGSSSSFSIRNSEGNREIKQSLGLYFV